MRRGKGLEVWPDYFLASLGAARINAHEIGTGLLGWGFDIPRLLLAALSREVDSGPDIVNRAAYLSLGSVKSTGKLEELARTLGSLVETLLRWLVLICCWV